ncbi:hypothetical protein BQ8794_100067 [Mesorhizobium prunaredense]|uniref:ATP-dependent DNA ligase n=1 Tax=Mesorhizobium prunaredense TaxID=1631249 RepID=A0A1R3V1T0_9HYPH|nr:hypothetical protein BQ8794_100067 [Mesorhizobium prunaredense]
MTRPGSKAWFRSAGTANIAATAWLKTKAYSIDEFELLGVEREAGKPAFALMAERGTGRYVGSAFITLNQDLRERLWKRVQEHAGAPPKGMKRPATQWVKPGVIGRVKHLRGEDARYKTKKEQKPKTDDKRLISALVVPIYNAEHVYTGSHLSDLNLTMTPINANRTPGDYLRLNERPRYHYLEFDDQVRLVSQIADFKHYFSVNLLYLEKIRASNFVCRISEIFREDMSLRFAAYLARIGLPSELRAKNSTAPYG